MMKLLPLLLLLPACRTPDEFALSPWYGTSAATWSGEGRDFDGHESGLMGTWTWSLGKRYEAYSNLAALDVSKAGQLTLRDDHHSPAPAPAPAPEPAPPEWDWFAPFHRVPQTLEEALLLGIYMMTLIGGIVSLKRFGILDKLPFFRKDK